MGNNNKHVLYEMIVAKAADMDLIQFVYNNHFEKWVECVGQEDVRFVDGGMYFLCLPKNKEVCLHWLNGGETQVIGSEGLWSRVFEFESYPWEEGHCFMDEDAVIRIKPRKEKRWISWNTRLGVIASTYKSEPEPIANHQIIEFEIEVQ